MASLRLSTLNSNPAIGRVFLANSLTRDSAAAINPLMTHPTVTPSSPNRSRRLFSNTVHPPTTLLVIIMLCLSCTQSDRNPSITLTQLGYKPTLAGLIDTVMAGNMAMTDLYLELDLDINQRDPQRRTALTEAARNGYLEIVKRLIHAGAKLEISGQHRASPLLGAVYEQRYYTARLLINEGADLLQRDAFGSTALHRAARVGNTRLVELLLSHGALASISNASDSQPLMEAATMGHNPVVQLLLNAGVDPGPKNIWGDDAATIANKLGYPETAQLILQYH